MDKVVSQGGKRQAFDRQQSSTSQRSIRKLSDGLTLTLRKPLKLRNSSDRCATDDINCVKTVPRKKPTSDASAGRGQRITDDATSIKVWTSTDAGRRTTNRHLSCERTAGRMFSESSTSDSEPDICGPCIARDSTATVACSRVCPPKCSRHASKAGILKTAEGRPSKSTSEAAASVTRSQSTRRALRQFFRVENLFACRQGRPGSDKYGSRDSEHQAEETTSRVESSEEAGRRRGCEAAAATYRGRGGRSGTESTLRSETRTCRRSRHQSRSSRRADGGGAASTASRSVSPHVRSRAADERRATTGTGTCGRAATRHRSRDRSSTVDRCRHAWNGVVVDDAAATGDWNGRGGQRWNTLCVSPSDNSILTPESGCGFSNRRRRVLATTPISPSTPAPDSLHTVTLGKCFVRFGSNSIVSICYGFVR